MRSVMHCNIIISCFLPNPNATCEKLESAHTKAKLCPKILHEFEREPFGKYWPPVNKDVA